MSNTSNSLSGRVAVVTGASGGLGLAICARLNELGAQVVRTDLKAPNSADAGGSKGHFVACDITDESSVRSAAQFVRNTFARCEVLVNNAGILLPPAPTEDFDVDMWDKVFSVNTRGAFLCCKHFGPMMLERQSGSIINFASIAATVPNQLSPYGPSKAAVLAFSRQLALEWGPRGVRVNSLSPGMIRTPMSEQYYQDEKIHSARKAAIALRRIGVPQDIASVVGFLAGDDAAYVSGQEIVVDGGFLLTSLATLQSASSGA